jgi:predicted dehydrogenase
MTNNKLRFGVLSTADIGNKVIAIMNQSDHAQPVAVASRELAKAQKFAEKHKIPKAYGSYEELLADPEVDAVYVPLPTALR